VLFSDHLFTKLFLHRVVYGYFSAALRCQVKSPSSNKSVSLRNSLAVADKVTPTCFSSNGSKLSLYSSTKVEETDDDDANGLLRTVLKLSVADPPGNLIQSLDNDRNGDGSLETELTDFRKTTARFKGNTFGQHFIGKDDKRPLLFDDSEDVEETKEEIQSSKQPTASLTSDIVVDIMCKPSSDDCKMPTAAAGVLKKNVAIARGDIPASGDVLGLTTYVASRSIDRQDSASTDMNRQMELLRTQVSLQVKYLL